MQEIKCPKCGEFFQIDESGYASIVKQVRDNEFLKDIKDRETQLLKDKESAVKLAVIEAVSEKDKEISNLKSKLDLMESNKKVEITQAVLEKEKQLSEQREKIALLNGLIESNEQASKLKEQTLKESYEEKLKDKDTQIAYYKDFKAKQSTKMVGESLEQHCEIEFNKIRATGFQNAYFEKDNDAKTGSKGDFIFREASEDGTEFISIMFEMKNEMDETATKHKNEEFFKKLDEDRRKKGCEYAVLVSLLEPDNDFYNEGIVDVSYRYPKMFVVRPQFFMPLISLLTQASKKSVEYQRELMIARQQSIDVTKFEDKLNDFKNKFGDHYQRACTKFNKAIEEIDKTIKSLQQMKADLLSSENYLRLANNDTEDLTIKKLTRGNPTMKQKFEEARTIADENLIGSGDN